MFVKSEGENGRGGVQVLLIFIRKASAYGLTNDSTCTYAWGATTEHVPDGVKNHVHTIGGS